MTEDYQHAISGLLRKRAELTGEAECIRGRLSEITNDMGALDRTLALIGYSGDLPISTSPRRERKAIFGRGGLSRPIFDELRRAGKPLSTRELALAIIAMRGEDTGDRKYVADITERAGRALRTMREKGHVRSAVDAEGNLSWGRR